MFVWRRLNFPCHLQRGKGGALFATDRMASGVRVQGVGGGAVSSRADARRLG